MIFCAVFYYNCVFFIIFVCFKPLPMETSIKILDKTFVPFIKEEEISAAIEGLADRMNDDFAGVSEENAPILLCTLNGAVPFTGALLTRLRFPVEMAAIRVASYLGTESTGEVRTILGLEKSVKGRLVIVAEDIVDTGNTIEQLCKTLREEGAAGVRICTLLLKPDVYKKNIPLDYVALQIPNRFIVGFGLDYNGFGRNTRDIYVLQ